MPYIDRTYVCHTCKIYSGHPLIYCVNCPNKVSIVKDYYENIRKNYYDNPEWRTADTKYGQDQPWIEKRRVLHGQIMTVLKEWATRQDQNFDRYGGPKAQEEHENFVEEVNKCFGEYDLQKVLSKRIGGKENYIMLGTLVYLIKKAFRLEKIDEEELKDE